jgi:DUF971 family protein
MSTPWPVKLAFRKAEKRLCVMFDDGAEYLIPYELLRVESPSAEVQGHHHSQKQLVTGKSEVDVLEAEPVGRYAVRLKFDDGHSSGIYSWSYLHELGESAETLMSDYHQRVKAARQAPER